MPIVTIEGLGPVDVEAGKKLVLAIEDAGIDIMHKCGGNARCTTCRVQLLGGDPAPMQELERERLAREPGVGPDIRLSCQIRVESDLSVRVVNPVVDVRKAAGQSTAGLTCVVGCHASVFGSVPGFATRTPGLPRRHMLPTTEAWHPALFKPAPSVAGAVSHGPEARIDQRPARFPRRQPTKPTMPMPSMMTLDGSGTAVGWMLTVTLSRPQPSSPGG